MYLVPAALSLHQEDGSTPRFVIASLPDPDSQDQGGEKFYLFNPTRSKRSNLAALTS